MKSEWEPYISFTKCKPLAQWKDEHRKDSDSIILPSLIFLPFWNITTATRLSRLEGQWWGILLEPRKDDNRFVRKWRWKEWSAPRRVFHASSEQNCAVIVFFVSELPQFSFLSVKHNVIFRICNSSGPLNCFFCSLLIDYFIFFSLWTNCTFSCSNSYFERSEKLLFSGNGQAFRTLTLNKPAVIYWTF